MPFYLSDIASSVETVIHFPEACEHIVFYFIQLLRRSFYPRDIGLQFSRVGATGDFCEKAAAILNAATVNLLN